MSDLGLASDPILSDAPILGPSLGVDASAIDQNLRAIRNVQSTWRLPELPSSVALDLANHPAGHQAVTSLLTGLDADLNNNGIDDSLEAPFTPLPLLSVRSWLGTFNEQERTSFDEARILISSLRGQKPPTELNANANQLWKMRAIEKGYLERPGDGVVDGSWSPELNSLRKEMAYDDLDRSYRGDRPGALPFGKTLEMIGKWTSPSGLLRAAMDLDLIWNPAEIGNDLASIPERWNKLSESEGPVDFAKNLFNATVGVVDSIVVPAINLALLFTGVGEVANFAKLGLFAGKAAVAADEVGGIYKLVKSVDYAADAARLGESSFLASKLKNGGQIATKLGDTMDAWRGLSGVKQVKKGVQVGMRLGIANNAERALGYEGRGFGLGDIDPIREAADKAVQNQWLTSVGEAFFTPYTIFEPGSFVSGARGLGGFAISKLGTTGGRAVAGAAIGAGLGSLSGDSLEGAAIGAAAGAGLPGGGKVLSKVAEAVPGRLGELAGVKLVGHAGDFLQRMSYKPLLNDERISGQFHKGVLRYLESEPEKLSAYQESFRTKGFQKAFAEHFTGGDEEAAGGMMAYVTLSGSIDRTARIQAGAEGSKGWWERYYLARNKLTAQVRSFDLNGGDTFEDVVWAGAVRNATKGWNKKREYQLLLNSTDPARAAEVAAAHNRLAHDTVRQLLSIENLPDIAAANSPLTSWTNLASDVREGFIDSYLAAVLPTFGNWTKYEPTVSEISSATRSGLFEEAALAPVDGYYGKRVNLRPEAATIKAAEGWSDGEQVGSSITRHLFTDPDVSMVNGYRGNLAPLAREDTPGRAAFTVARKETVSKQELLAAHSELKAHLDALKDYRSLTTVRKSDVKRVIDDTTQVSDNLLTSAASAGVFSTDLDTLSNTQISEMIGRNLSKRDTLQVRRLKRFMDKNGITETTGLGYAVTSRIRTLQEDARWGERYGLASIRHADDGRVLQGEELLSTWAKSLSDRASRTAAEVDAEDLLAKLEQVHGTASPEYQRMRALVDHTEASGYKIVHGSDFLMPHELSQYSGIFRDVNQRHENMMTLGNFFGRQRPEALQRRVEAAQRAAISAELRKVNHGLKDVGPEGADTNQIMRDLYDNVLTPAQARGTNTLDDYANMSWAHKVISNVKTAKIPMSRQDLGFGVHEKLVVGALTKVGYTEEAAKAVWLGLKKGRYAEFNDLGLASIEQKLRARSQLTDALHLMPTIAGAGIGAAVASDDVFSYENLGDTLKGAAIGATAGNLIGRGTGLTKQLDKAAQKFDHSKWARYAYLADNTARLRDHMRFTMSPFFDASRYTESYFLSATAGDKRLRVNQSPKAYMKQYANELTKTGTGPQRAAQEARAWYENEVLAGFRDASRMPNGMPFDPAAVESTGLYFRQVGMLGFDPTAWQASTWHQMVKLGYDPAEAFQKVKEMYTYGTTGRSAAEQSVNFIFFPFSFQKKAITHAAKFLSDDLSRAVMLHDGYKAYQTMDENGKLGEWIDTHAPILEKLQQLNMFAYGLSPGRLGGINAPFIDAGLNFFGPQGVSIQNAEDANTFQTLAKRMVPAYNDVEHFTSDATSQFHVFFDSSHKTRAAQAGEGYKEWNEYKKGLIAALEESGYTYGDLSRNDQLAPAYEAFKSKRAQLLEKYPGWAESKVRYQSKLASLSQGKEVMLEQVKEGNATPEVQAFGAMEDLVSQGKQALVDLGLTDWEDADPTWIDQIKGVAVSLAAQAPRFALLYSQYYEPIFGPLEAQL